MTDDRPLQSEPTHRCPECGRDVCVTRELVRRWTHSAMLLPFLAWVGCVLALAVFASPWTQARLGNHLAIYSGTSVASSEYAGALRPTITAAELLEPTADTRSRIDEAFGTLASRFAPWWKDGPTRFVFMSKDGSRVDQLERGLGAAWISERATTQMSDVTHEPVGDGPWDYPDEHVVAGKHNQYAAYASLPWGLERRGHRISGGQMYHRSYHPFSLMVSLTVALVLIEGVIRAARWILNTRGRRITTPRWVRRAIVPLLLLAFILVGYHRTQEYHWISSQKIDPTSQQLDVFLEPDAFEQLLLHDPTHEALIAHLRPLAERAPPGSILGYHSDRATTFDYERYGAMITQHFELLSFTTRRFMHEDPDGLRPPTNRPAYPHSMIKFEHDPLWRWIAVTYNRPSSSHGVMLYWVHLIFLGLLLWIMLRIFRSVFRFVANLFIYRTQRKRLNNHQCIFCAYPLSAEALAARWEDAPPPS